MLACPDSAASTSRPTKCHAASGPRSACTARMPSAAPRLKLASCSAARPSTISAAASSREQPCACAIRSMNDEAAMGRSCEEERATLDDSAGSGHEFAGRRGSERRDLHHGVQIQRAVDVREQPLAALQVLALHGYLQPCLVDVQQHQVLPPAKPLVGDPAVLVGFRAVDEAFGGERVRRIGPAGSGGVPGGGARDVENHAGLDYLAAIFAQASFSVTVRLKTGAPARESGSVQK